MKELYIAFVWNQHQPYYQDREKKEYIMPWTRLHAAKDYYRMAALLEQYPAIHQTFNLTPSLLEQIEDYLAGTADYYQRVTKPAEELSEPEKRFLLQHFFDIQWDLVIRQQPRYRELLEKQGMAREPAAVAEALSRYSLQDYRDLQVWFNLAWIDPEQRQEDPFLNGLERKGKNFTERELRAVMERHFDLMSKVIPVHRRLRDRGRIELMTTPFYHPILPLLLDTSCALRASPGLPLPRRRFSFPRDASEQLKRAREYFGRLFGGSVRGVWPPEQAVSPELIPLFADQGFTWTISDEQVLAHSLHVEISRDAYGHVLNGDLLYRPYRVRSGGSELAIIFRDHHLSDRIGFEYQKFQPDDAAADLVHRLHKIRENLSRVPGEHLVTIALDGENAWEWYRGDKGPFLHGLYRRLSEDLHLHCVTVSEFLAANPPQRTINRLFTGSWVDHNLTRWIGTENKNKYWDYLLLAREAVEAHGEGTKKDPERLQQAMDSILIAEGSDYAWWIDSMPYYLAAPFESLFRKHLAGVYRALDMPVPSHLHIPLIQPQPGEAAWSVSPLAGPLPMVLGGSNHSQS